MIPVELEAEKKEIIKRYKHLLKVTKFKNDDGRKLIRKAFDTALEAHKDMRRKSGEPYIYHPIEVARIVAEEIGLGATSVACALLHDTVEDTDITLADVKRMFGDKAERIIDGLTKISGVVDHNVSLQAENFRKILVTLSDDVRVILIKLADRLHNMRTLDSMRRDKQLKIASETLYLFAPLAHRLGLYSIKSELEDLALKYTEPEIFEEITAKLKKTKAVRTRFVNQFSIPIRKALEEQGFKFEIKARTKSVFSIYDKIKNKNVSFEEIYDIFAIRIIIDSAAEKEKADCWTIYSIVTDFYQPSPDRLRDWISTPRANGYESLHTTVMSPTGKWVEVQIRSDRMDQVAEKGFAAHWKYKEGGEESNFDAWVSKIRELLENTDNETIDFIDDFKLNLFAKEIFVFTPNGDVKSLPMGATALDFAFEIHSQVGEKCIGAKVNTKLVPLSHELKSGDQIEIITSKKQKPTESWLDYVITGKAKAKIRSALKEDKRRIAEDGKEILQRKLKKLKIPFSSDNITELLSYYRLPSPLELYYKVAINKVKLGKLDNVPYENGKFNWNKQDQKISTSKQFEEVLRSKGQADEMLVIGEDMEHFDYKLSPCCSPIPGDEVFGFITIHEGIKIHKTNCPNAVQLLGNYAYRVVKARWTSQEQIAFLAGIKVTGIDDVGIVNNITKLISMELNVNMRSISFDSNDGVFEGKIMVFVHDTRHLTDLIKKLKNIKGVINISRIDTA